MSLFLDFSDTIAPVENVSELPIYKEVMWDFERNVPKLIKKEYQYVYKNEAIKVWCYKSLLTSRYRFIIYTYNYGCELECLIGEAYTEIRAKAECIRYVEECLKINPYILDVENIVPIFNHGKLNITADLITIYGKDEISICI